MMTENGVTTTKTLGQEQYEVFFNGVGRKRKPFVQYDYRDMTGELFSTVKPTLMACRTARDNWLKNRKEGL